MACAQQLDVLLLRFEELVLLFLQLLDNDHLAPASHPHPSESRHCLRLQRVLRDEKTVVKAVAKPSLYSAVESADLFLEPFGFDQSYLSTD